MTDGKKIGILGSGDVAKNLGQGFAVHGYDVRLGTREPAKLEEWRKTATGKVSVGSPTDAAAYGPIAVLATHGSATESVLDAVGPKRFSGKLVIDATNPLVFAPDAPITLFVGLTDSLGERVQRKLPDARVVKCFNTVASTKMVDPKFASGPARMWICGNDAEAKRTVEALVKELGWGGVTDVGGIDGARWLEAMVPLWLRIGLASGTWGHVLQVVR